MGDLRGRKGLEFAQAKRAEEKSRDQNTRPPKLADSREKTKVGVWELTEADMILAEKELERIESLNKDSIKIN